MRRFHEITLDELGKQSFLDVEIEFTFRAGEPEIRFPFDQQYPGSPPEAELIRLSVLTWGNGGEYRKRGDSWIWNDLDRIAGEIITNNWEDSCRDDCISDAVEREKER